jgi:anthranilate synthase component II
MKFLVVDNYDSFVYNISQRLGELNIEPMVIRSNKITMNAVKTMDPDAIVISPGPGHPANRRYFGICTDIITDQGPRTPILGICLGHQGIIHAFGGRIINAKKIRHGKISIIEYNMESKGLFEKVANPFKATRYNSLVSDKQIPSCLEVTASSLDDNEIMAVRHKHYLIEGVQFHPESVLTEEGPKIFRNFISMVKR